MRPIRQLRIKHRVNISLRGLGSGLLDAVAPRRCALCDQPSHCAYALCEVCRGELHRNARACRQCALPLLAGELCAECLRDPPGISRSTIPYCYNDALAYLIGRWKYHGDEYLSDTLAALWLQAAGEPAPCDALLPVPLHWRRQLRRGYNQSQLLLDALCRRRPGLLSAARRAPRLRRCRATAVQAGADRRSRQRNLRAAFALQGAATGLRVALIDDVCTTGATARAAAAVLNAAGAEDVQLWCIARTPPR